MRKIAIILLIVPILLSIFQCGGKKPPKPIELTDPKYYFVINVDYMWLYIRIGPNCIVTNDTISITVPGKSDRYIEGIKQTGWDLVTLPGGDTSFAYQVSDTILYIPSIRQTIHPYRILVGPVQAGTFWKGRPPYDYYDYSIVGFEDVYSPVAGETYRGCAKVRRTSSGTNNITYYWWSTEFGKVKEIEYHSEQCFQGMELKYLDKTHIIP
jgi:hypothetical protein